MLKEEFFERNAVDVAKDLIGCRLIKRWKYGKIERLNGPGKLTRYLNIDKKFNGKIANKKTELWIDGRPKMHDRAKVVNQKFKIIKTPRIGVSYAGPVWSRKKYRFVLSGFETKKFK